LTCILYVSIIFIYHFHDLVVVKDYKGKIYSLKEELFKLRGQQATGQLKNGKTMTAVRKDIARILTIIRERELGLK
jgi:large subunit ribosomal protein L29